MIWMTKMETIVMNMTGCNRQTANLVVNTIWDEIYNAENENEKYTQKDRRYRIYFKSIDGTKQKTDAVFDDKFDASQRCFYLNDNVAIFGQYIYEEEQVEQ